jgi:hypothetical protein
MHYIFKLICHPELVSGYHRARMEEMKIYIIKIIFLLILILNLFPVLHPQ